MKKILLVCAFLATFAASAAELSFTYFGNDLGRQVYYSCDYVEDQATYYLNLLGANHIDVMCTGGIQNWSWMPIHLKAKFELPLITGHGVETLELQGDTWNPNCGLNTTIINAAVKTMTHIQVIKKSDSCPFVDSNFFYKLQVQH